VTNVTSAESRSSDKSWATPQLATVATIILRDINAVVTMKGHIYVPLVAPRPG
jgi:hypothetical protein